ncbi:MAG TPA: hypothetical protein PK156_10210 [Polyangium sp.]|nr:hypothetical protein [Polyangium sp.]
MFARLIIGILKGLVVGGLLGFALLKLGLGLFVGGWAFAAYLSAALAGVVVGLIAGKPIWAKDAKIEAGMKAFVGALLGAGLMFGLTKLKLPLGDAVLRAFGVMTKDPQTLATFPVTALALVASVLGGFYEADNTPEPAAASSSAGKPSSAGKTPSQKRVAAPSADEDLGADELDESLETDDKKAKK